MRSFTLSRHDSGSYLASNEEFSCTSKTAEDALTRLSLMAGVSGGFPDIHNSHEAAEFLDDLIGKWHV